MVRSDCLSQICPLISLMIEQVKSLRKVDVSAAFLPSGADAPKDLLCNEILITISVMAVVVDEAHCVSKWNRDFRPAYDQLHEVRALVPKGTSLLACTTTAILNVRKDIVKCLQMERCKVISKCRDRTNIFYSVHSRPYIHSEMRTLMTSLN